MDFYSTILSLSAVCNSSPQKPGTNLDIRRGDALAVPGRDRGGLAKGRFIIETMGAEQPVSDDDSNRGGLRNRRVEVKLFVPKR